MLTSEKKLNHPLNLYVTSFLYLVKLPEKGLFVFANNKEIIPI